MRTQLDFIVRTEVIRDYLHMTEGSRYRCHDSKWEIKKWRVKFQSNNMRLPCSQVPAVSDVPGQWYCQDLLRGKRTREDDACLLSRIVSPILFSMNLKHELYLGPLTLCIVISLQFQLLTCFFHEYQSLTAYTMPCQFLWNQFK